MPRGRRIDDVEFRRLVDAAKDRKNLSDIVGRHTRLKPRGRSEKVGLCPFHEESSPSFEVNDAKGLFHCHGCGAAGDHFRALMTLDGMSFRDAYTALTNDTFPTVSDEDRAKQRAEDEKARATAIDDARDMWAACMSIEGTAGEVYLRDVRGITTDLPPVVRFGFVPTSRDVETGEWKRPYPAVVLGCANEANDLVGLQRIFLRDDGRDKRWGKRSKFSLGRPRDGAVRLGPAAQQVVLCEGPEDGLSLAQEMPGRSVWVALGTAMMPEVRLPPIVTSVVIAGQNDKAGRVAVAAAAKAMDERGLDVRTMFPRPQFKDWNDVLRGIAMEAAS